MNSGEIADLAEHAGVDPAALIAEFEKIAAMAAKWPEPADVTPLESLYAAFRIFEEWGFCGEMAVHLRAYLRAPEAQRIPGLLSTAREEGRREQREEDIDRLMRWAKHYGAQGYEVSELSTARSALFLRDSMEPPAPVQTPKTGQNL